MSQTIITHCRYCLSLCGLKVTVNDDRESVLNIEPDRENPYSWQDFCRKGRTADQVRNHPHRIVAPMKRVGDEYVAATYDEALDDIAARLNAIIDTYGPDAVGSYHGNPLAFSFHDTIFHAAFLDSLGTGNKYWVGSVDQNASHIVQKEMYGSEILGMGGDIDECDYFLLVGMDPAVSKFGWMESVPNGWYRVMARQAQGAKVVVVDPRRSASAARADAHLAVLPGSDWALLLGLVKVILDEGLSAHSTAVPLQGIDAMRELIESIDLSALSAICDVPTDQMVTIAREFASARTAMCISHTGVAHNHTGTIGEWLANVINALTDRLDTPGGKRFERGLLDLSKAFEMMAPASEHRTRIRDLAPIAGFHALAELPQEITTPGPGQIRAMVIASGNPVVSGPDGTALDRALSQLDLLVAVDMVQRESHRHAHWLIPGTHWLERSELNPMFSTVANRPFAQAANAAVRRPDGVWEEWEFFLELTLRMKRPLFGYRGASTIARTSRWLARLLDRPGLGMNGRWIERALVLSGRRSSYRSIIRAPHGKILGERRYGDLAKALRTPDGAVHVAPTLLVEECRRVLETAPGTNPEFPFYLVNRRDRESMNSWLNETAGLFEGDRQTYVEIHPADARELDLIDGQTVRIVSATAAILAPTRFCDGGRRGVVTMPHGWGSRVFDPRTGAARSFGVNKNLLTDNTELDRLSQTPGFNSTRVRIEPVAETFAETEPAR